MADFDPQVDYPLGSRRPELVRTPSGLSLDEVGLDTQLAENLERAAELALVPDDALLDVYTALRPHRSSGSELEDWAVRLEGWGAVRTAAFVREAAAAYAERGLLARG